MNGFSEILGELMQEAGANASTLASSIGLADPSVVYRWLKGEKGLLLDTAIKIADYFECSLDYLFGLSQDFGNPAFSECLQFDAQLRRTLKEQKVSQNKLIRNGAASRGDLHNWLNKKRTPHINGIIRLANYLGISMDYLVGRES